MIITETKGTAKIIGDIQSNSVSIDLSNIGFITQLLSTNLYSRPIESFLRETVSNAWDSHVEAGNDSPILLELGTDTENRNYCRIQDFGVGLSPERFNSIYKNIGSSTKREDNTQIGGFGIGRFSALAYSDSVYLTSNYQGIKYKYLMYKDGNIIKIDELFNGPTTDADGLEVMVYILSGDISSFKDAIKDQLIYFENLFISIDRLSNSGKYLFKDFADKFNDLKIKRYKTFSVNSLSTNRMPTLCLGKIQYPLNSYSIKNSKFKFNNNYPITVNFEIGELEVTPNREQVSYSKRNVEIIEKRLDEVQDELNAIVKEQSIADYTDFRKYINQLSDGTVSINLLEHNNFSYGFKVLFRDSAITYMGKSYSKSLVDTYNYIYNNASNEISKHVSFKASDKRLYVKMESIYVPYLSSLFSGLDGIHDLPVESLKSKVYVGKYSEMNENTKNYIRQNAINNSYFLKEIHPYKLLRVILRKVELSKKNSYYDKYEFKKEELKLVVKCLIDDLNKIPRFNNEDVPASFIAQSKIALKAKKTNSIGSSMNWSEEVNLFKLRLSDKSNYNGISVTSDSERVSLSTIKKNWNKFPVIYSVKDDKSLRELFWVFNNCIGLSYRKYVFVEIAPTKIKILNQFPNFIPIEQFMNIEYKKIRMLATARYISNNYPHISTLYLRKNSLKSISLKLNDAVCKINEYVQDNSIKSSYWASSTSSSLEILKDIDSICEKHNYYDGEMMGYLKKHEKLLENAKFISLFPVYGSGIESKLVNIVVDYALSRRLFKPDLEAVKKLKKETIFNIKEENNENN